MHRKTAPDRLNRSDKQPTRCLLLSWTALVGLFCEKEEREYRKTHICEHYCKENALKHRNLTNWSGKTVKTSTARHESQEMTQPPEHVKSLGEAKLYGSPWDGNDGSRAGAGTDRSPCP